MGCMRTIKTLERENQAKSDKIQSLSLELEKKNKHIESLQTEKSALLQSQSKMSIQEKLQESKKKKQADMELKIKDQENTIGE